jgi:DNA-binding transcriptional MerR regulator
MHETFTIAELASEFRVTARAIRFYEDKGMLAPARQGLQRVFSRRDRARLSLILRGKRLGFSLAEIREMLDLYDVNDGQRQQLQVTLSRARVRLKQLEEQRRDIEDAINELQDGIDGVEAYLTHTEKASQRRLSFAEFIARRGQKSSEKTSAEA